MIRLLKNEYQETVTKAKSMTRIEKKDGFISRYCGSLPTSSISGIYRSMLLNDDANLYQVAKEADALVFLQVQVAKGCGRMMT